MEFARLAHTFEELERTNSRLALIELLTEPFRLVEGPEEIKRICYLVQGRVAPFFEALEMGMAEKTVARSIALAAHTTPEDVLQRYATLGDMGLVAEQLRRVDEVFLGLRAIAQTAGKGAIEQKIARLADLLTQVDGVSAKYVVRILVLATWHIRSKNWSFSKNGYAT